MSVYTEVRSVTCNVSSLWGLFSSLGLGSFQTSSQSVVLSVLFASVSNVASDSVCRLSKRRRMMSILATTPLMKMQGPHLGLHPAALQQMALPRASQQSSRPLRRPPSRGRLRRGLLGRVGSRGMAREATSLS